MAGLGTRLLLPEGLQKLLLRPGPSSTPRASSPEHFLQIWAPAGHKARRRHVGASAGTGVSAGGRFVFVKQNQALKRKRAVRQSSLARQARIHVAHPASSSGAARGWGLACSPPGEPWSPPLTVPPGGCSPTPVAGHQPPGATFTKSHRCSTLMSGNQESDHWDDVKMSAGLCAPGGPSSLGAAHLRGLWPVTPVSAPVVVQPYASPGPHLPWRLSDKDTWDCIMRRPDNPGWSLISKYSINPIRKALSPHTRSR